MLPWSLDSMADAALRLRSGQANYGAEEKIGHSGRDDKAKIGKTKSRARNRPAKNTVCGGGGRVT
jgi:hypothetical protein